MSKLPEKDNFTQQLHDMKSFCRMTSEGNELGQEDVINLINSMDEAIDDKSENTSDEEWFKNT